MSAAHTDAEAFVADLPGGLLTAIRGVRTPFYVLDIARVRQRAEAFRRALERVFPRTAVAYPYKVNSIAEVARAAVGVYGHAESGTDEELQLAVDHGCPATQCFVGGVGKSEDLLARAVCEGATLKIDSIAELRRLRSVVPALPVHKQFRVLLRISLPVGDRWSRFGLRPEDVASALEEGESWVRFVRGVHFHAGTNNQDAAPYVDAIRRCAPVLRVVQARLGDAWCPVMDIGGGYPSCVDRDVGSTAERYLSSVASTVEDEGWPLDAVEIVCEPGRVTVERAGYLVAKVIERSDWTDRRCVIVDAGCTVAGGSWSTVRSGRSALFLDSRSSIEAPCDIFGNLCFEDDRVAEDAVVIKSEHPDPVAIVGDVGGYRLSGAAPWMQKVPTVYALENGQLDTVRGELPLQSFS